MPIESFAYAAAAVSQWHDMTVQPSFTDPKPCSQKWTVKERKSYEFRVIFARKNHSQKKTNQFYFLASSSSLSPYVFLKIFHSKRSNKSILANFGFRFFCFICNCFFCRKLFVGGLSWETSQDNLQRYFSRYGEVIDCVVMKNAESGRSRGFGFVTFADPANVTVVLQNGPHTLDGR